MKNPIILTIFAIILLSISGTCQIEIKNDKRNYGPQIACLSKNKDTLSVLNNGLGDIIIKTWEKTCKYTKKRSQFKTQDGDEISMEYWETSVNKVALNEKTTIIPPKIIIKVEAISSAK